jgi:hypothetical protein
MDAFHHLSPENVCYAYCYFTDNDSYTDGNV